MSSQNQIILSLGSNQGDRLKLLQKAINQIHTSVGMVVQISAVYETASWGFESDAFYNCALLVHSYLPAKEVLNRALQIEKDLGRIRSSSKDYSARIIDIDIIVFNEEIIESEDLFVPHQFMQERRFVLQPASDLSLSWTHPILNKNIKQLLEDCSDTSECRQIGELLSLSSC